MYIRTPTESLHLLTVGEISRWREKIWQTSSAQDLISWPTNALRVCYQTHFHREINRVSLCRGQIGCSHSNNVTAAWHYVNGQWLLIMYPLPLPFSICSKLREPLPPCVLIADCPPLILAFLNAYTPWDFFSINNPFYRRWPIVFSPAYLDASK